MILRLKTGRKSIGACFVFFLLNGCTTNCGHPPGEPQAYSYAYIGRILDGVGGKVLADVDVWVGEELYTQTSETGFSIETGDLCSSSSHPAYRLRARKKGYVMLDTTFRHDSLEIEVSNKYDGLHQLIKFPDMPLLKQ